MSRMYARTGAILSVVIRPMMRYYFSKRPSRRVRVIVFDNKGNMLLIKGWLSRQQWDLPGGGINKGEHDTDAAVRELYEETGLTIKADQMTLLGEFFYTDMTTPYTVVLFMVKTEQVATKTPRKYRWEIIDQGWFSVKKLPQNISLLVSRSLQKASELE